MEQRGKMGKEKDAFNLIKIYQLVITMAFKSKESSKMIPDQCANMRKTTGNF